MTNQRLLTDFEIIRLALRDFSHLAQGLRYGGLYQEFEHAKEALAALDRIERPQLPGMEERESK